MNDNKNDLYDDILKEALDNLFETDFEKYSENKNKNVLNDYTLLNIPKINTNNFIAPDIDNVNEEYKLYDDDILRRRINSDPSSKKRPITPVRVALACVALFFVMAIGYTLFNENIIINGKASVNGALSLSYICDVVSSGELKSDGKGECSIVGGKIKTTSVLYKPGENVNYAVTVTNNGNFPVTLYDVLSTNNFEDGFVKSGDEIYLNNDGFLSAKYVIHHNGNKYVGDKYVESSSISIEPSASLLVIINHNWLSLEKQPNLKEDAVINYDVILTFKQHID